MTTRHHILTAAVAAALALAGCSSDDPAAEDTAGTDQNVQPAPANPGTVDQAKPSEAPTQLSDEEREEIEQQMTPGEATKDQLDAIRAYLEVRENAESTKYDDREEWEEALEKVTTDQGLETVLESYSPADNSNARMVATEREYEVQVSVGECVENPGWGEDNNTIAVQCELTDLVYDDQGMVPSQDVDNTWPYYGEQESPILVLTKDGDKWLLDGDFTGKAS